MEQFSAKFMTSGPQPRESSLNSRRSQYGGGFCVSESVCEITPTMSGSFPLLDQMGWSFFFMDGSLDRGPLDCQNASRIIESPCQLLKKQEIPRFLLAVPYPDFLA